MKKLFSLLVVIGLGLFTLGCNGDPGVVEDMPDPGVDEMEGMEIDPVPDGTMPDDGGAGGTEGTDGTEPPPA